VVPFASCARAYARQININNKVQAKRRFKGINIYGTNLSL
jgi:hypothetical protein